MAYLPSPLPLRTAISPAVCGWALSALASAASDTIATQQTPTPLEEVTIIGDRQASREIAGLTGDGTDTPAVRLADELSSRFEAPLELVHAIPSTRYPGSMMPGADLDALDHDRRAEARRQVDARLETLGIPDARREQALRIETGSPARVLVERARALDAGMIVVGRHRPRTILDLGSTARALMVHVSVVVPVASPEMRGMFWGTILSH